MDDGRVIILGGSTLGNAAMVEGFGRLGFTVHLLDAHAARRLVRDGDVVIARLDVLPTLDGMEPGLVELLWLERSGVHVVNSVRSLLIVHDKLLTARCLADAGLPHPRTWHVTKESDLREIELPAVVKPRFGSWGRDVMRCRDRAELERCVAEIRGRSWFRRHGAIVQELLPLGESDLRIVVAFGHVVGAAERTAAPGEWRTNVSLGGSRRSADPPEDARCLAIRAAAAAGSDLVGVDLFPAGSGGWAVLELNGAVDFDDRYALPARNIYADLAAALELRSASAELDADSGQSKRATGKPKKQSARAPMR